MFASPSQLAEPDGEKIRGDRNGIASIVLPSLSSSLLFCLSFSLCSLSGWQNALLFEVLAGCLQFNAPGKRSVVRGARSCRVAKRTFASTISRRW